MFAQPSTDAFKPTISPPATTGSDAGGLVGGDGGLVGADGGLVGISGDAGEGAREGVGADGVDAGRPAGDCVAGAGFPARARGPWKIAFRFALTQMRFRRWTQQTTRVDFRLTGACLADASAGGTVMTLAMITAARRYDATRRVMFSVVGVFQRASKRTAPFWTRV